MNRFFTTGYSPRVGSACSGRRAEQPVFRSRGDVVRVFVTVTEGDGRLVTTLDRRPTSRCATKASRSRSRCSTTAPSPFGSS